MSIAILSDFASKIHDYSQRNKLTKSVRKSLPLQLYLRCLENERLRDEKSLLSGNKMLHRGLFEYCDNMKPNIK